MSGGLQTGWSAGAGAEDCGTILAALSLAASSGETRTAARGFLGLGAGLGIRVEGSGFRGGAGVIGATGAGSTVGEEPSPQPSPGVPGEGARGGAVATTALPGATAVPSIARISLAKLR